MRNHPECLLKLFDQDTGKPIMNMIWKWMKMSIKQPMKIVYDPPDESGCFSRCTVLMEVEDVLPGIEARDTLLMQTDVQLEQKEILDLGQV